MGDDLELNRYRKHGGELVLEEYSHCEVPAGCGGAVLRWVRPGEPCTVEVGLFAGPDAQLRIDGMSPSSSRVELARGAHVLTIEATIPVLVVGLWLPHRQRVGRPSLVSLPDGTWRCCPTLDPPERWTTLDYDDRDWTSLAAGAAPEELGRTDRWRVDSLLQRGAVPLRVDSTDPLRARRRFVLDAEGLR